MVFSPLELVPAARRTQPNQQDQPLQRCLHQTLPTSEVASSDAFNCSRDCEHPGNASCQ